MNCDAGLHFSQTHTKIMGKAINPYLPSDVV
jgi:hypothetical protein